MSGQDWVLTIAVIKLAAGMLSVCAPLVSLWAARRKARSGAPAVERSEPPEESTVTSQENH
ncbi:hypothetical protein [Streptomyces sp. NPDC057403]|uniref:hypothetical protein n=1 Tax=Streptomyces sp. NPDC057403 TaxID=3346119 RepID=UPI0036B23B6E